MTWSTFYGVVPGACNVLSEYSVHRLATRQLAAAVYKLMPANFEGWRSILPAVALNVGIRRCKDIVSKVIIDVLANTNIGSLQGLRLRIGERHNVSAGEWSNNEAAAVNLQKYVPEPRQLIEQRREKGSQTLGCQCVWVG